MEGEARRGAEAGADNTSMGYMLTVGVMEEVQEKLKLLDYETDFCKSWGFRPLSRYEFVHLCHCMNNDKRFLDKNVINSIFLCRNPVIYNRNQSKPKMSSFLQYVAEIYVRHFNALISPYKAF